jgi:hypothetical protein
MPCVGKGFRVRNFLHQGDFVLTPPHPAPDGEAVDELDRAATEALALCDGDSLAAIKALLLANAFLERDLDLARRCFVGLLPRLASETSED